MKYRRIWRVRDFLDRPVEKFNTKVVFFEKCKKIISFSLYFEIGPRTDLFRSMGGSVYQKPKSFVVKLLLWRTNVFLKKKDNYSISVHNNSYFFETFT